MSTRISQKNRGGGEKPSLNLSLWKHLAKHCVLPACSTLWIFTWAHSVPRTHQTLGPSLPLPKKMRFPGVSLYLSVPFAAAICLVWETSNSSVTLLLPLWGRTSQITQLRFSPRVGLYSTGSAESEKMDLILNNCINVIEIHVVFHEGENDLFLTMVDGMHSGDPEYLGLFSQKFFVVVFFFLLLPLLWLCSGQKSLDQKFCPFP